MLKANKVYEDVYFDFEVNNGLFDSYMCEVIDNKTILFSGVYTETDTFEDGESKQLLVRLDEKIDLNDIEDIENLDIYSYESLELI
jgi:hypothetical protein